MLSAKNNELLTRVGPGTPMGEMLREYWWPVLRSDKLVADGAPERVRLMGEDYVAFRDTQGRVGVLEERCPHRGVSLMLARNENCGLTCILHGWKMTVDGKVETTPNEKIEGARLGGLKVRHLSVRETGGLIWVWAGKGQAPEFPDYAFARDDAVPTAMLGYMRCNWFQVMETLWDPSHVAILHAQGRTHAQNFEGLGDDVPLAKGFTSFYAAGVETRDEPFGFSYRFTEGVCSGASMPIWVPTVLPGWVYITTFAQNPYGDRAVIGHVPIDDENMMLVQITYNVTGEVGELGKRTRMGGIDVHNFVPTSAHRGNNWNQDREAMRSGSPTGLGAGMFGAGILLQDQAALESIGPIADRTREQIGPADHAIVKGRQCFLDALSAYIEDRVVCAAGEKLDGVGEDEAPQVKAEV